MFRFTRLVCIAALAVAAFASTAGAAVYQHSPGLNASSVGTQVAYVHSPGTNPAAYLTAFGIGTETTYAHSPGMNAYRYLDAFSPSQPSVSASTGSSFSWGDAGLGAGALAALLLLIGATIAVRRSGSRRLAV